MMNLIAKDIVGEHAISMQSGQFLYIAIKEKIEIESKIVIDFKGVRYFASPFFNASIGYLLKDMPIETLTQKLELINLSEVGRRLLNLVIANAINFYRNQNEENIKIIKKNADDI